MERLEYEIVSEVARVVDNYNAAISDSPTYDGTGEITLVGTPDDPVAFIDDVLLAMQKKKLELEEAGESDIAEVVNHCVLQVHDLKSQVE